MQEKIKVLLKNNCFICRWVIILLTIFLFFLSGIVMQQSSRMRTQEINTIQCFNRYNLAIVTQKPLPLDFLRRTYQYCTLGAYGREPTRKKLDHIDSEEDFIELFEDMDHIETMNATKKQLEMSLIGFQWLQYFLFALLIICNFWCLYIDSIGCKKNGQKE